MRTPSFAVLLVGLGAATLCQAQGDELSARDAPALAMEGYWISVVTEDWKYRMVSPNAGEYAGIPLNAAARAEADAWNASTGDACRVYGAANIMRVPTRLRIGWADEDTLRIETDAGSQRRLLHFGAATDAAGAPASLQGYSTAEWRYAAGESPADAGDNRGSMKVYTSRLVPGQLRANGVPYSAQTSMTEYFNVFDTPNGDRLLVITTIVEDPVYLSRPFYNSTHFKRLSDDSGWDPSAC